MKKRGIGLFVHWSFLLLPLYVILSDWMKTGHASLTLMLFLLRVLLRKQWLAGVVFVLLWTLLQSGLNGSFLNTQNLSGDLNGSFNPDFTNAGNFDFSSLLPSVGGGFSQDLDLGSSLNFPQEDFGGDF